MCWNSTFMVRGADPNRKDRYGPIGIVMALPDLKTRCMQCDQQFVISRMAAQMARPVECSHCGAMAYVYQLIGRSQRELPQPAVSEIGATWEGARP